MFPRESMLVRVKKIFRLKSNPSVYGNIQQTFYAHSTNRIRSIHDIWREKNESKNENEKLKSEWDTVESDGFLYFVIKTAVGVGAKGRNNINRIHIRFRLIPMHEGIRDPEVLSIYPNSISRPAEWISYYEQTKKEQEAALKVEGGAQAGELIPARGGIEASASVMKKKRKTKDYSLQYHVIIANASGTGSRAMWEFYQEEGMAAIGQFNLEIYFRIRSQDFIYLHRNEREAANELVRGYYCVDWNVEVNRERLVDHKIDRLDGCNIKVNGRQLMDRYQDYDSDNPQLKRKEDDEGYYQYWNVPIEDEPSQAETRLKKATRDEIFNMMCEEDPQAERLKMLRPLYLVFASGKRSRSGSHFIPQMTR